MRREGRNEDFRIEGNPYSRHRRERGGGYHAAGPAAAGSGLDKVVKTTCFLADIHDFALFNEVYAELFPGKPARSGVEVSKLPKGALVEIEAVAEA